MGELTQGEHTIKAKDVHIRLNKPKILVVFRSSKTHDKGSSPQKVKISAKQKETKHWDSTTFCPFKLVREYLVRRGEYITEDEPFLIFSNHSPVKPDQFRKVLRNMLIHLNLDVQLYDTHSMHAGRVCDLVNMGYTIEQVKSMGRWKSNAIYKNLKQY